MEPTAVGLRFLLAFVFLNASIPKLAARSEFRTAVANYQLLPDALIRPVSRWLPRAELACALALLFGIAVPLVSLAAGLMLLCFAAAVAVNLARGRVIECGCFGASVPTRITWKLVARDVLLALAAAAVASVVPRALALPMAWPGHTSAAVSAGDALALASAAALVVLLEAVVTEACRIRGATRRLLLARDVEVLA
jgi:uncharacterized membrane protein YphA (DoxX/SURF4 family)